MDLHQTLPTTSRLATLFALILPIPLMLASAPSLALGLGNASLKTAIGDPLTVDIPILDRSASLDTGQVRVRQVLGRSAEQMGYDLAADAQPFSLSVSELSGGLTIQVTSPAPLHEPFVSFLLELSWPGGTVYREYNLLVDLPPVAPPTGAAAPAQPASPAAQTPTPVDSVYTGKQWRVAPGQSLWRIARQVQPDSSIPLDAVMAAILARNPHAFINGDMNRLQAGALLDLPSAADYSAPPAVASRPTVAASASAERKPSPPAADTASPAARPEETPQARLRLSGSPAETSGSRAVRLGEEIDAVKEQLDKFKRENAQLREQIQRIEASEYLAVMQEMLQLQEQRIAELKAQMRTGDVTREGAGSAGTTPVDSNAGAAPAAVIVRDTGPGYAALLLLILTGIVAGVALSQLQEWWRKRREDAEPWPESEAFSFDPLATDWGGVSGLPASPLSASRYPRPATRSAIFPPPAPELEVAEAEEGGRAAAGGEEEGLESTGSPVTPGPDSLFEELQLDESFGQGSADVSTQDSPAGEDDLVLDFAAFDPLPLEEIDPVDAESAPGAAESSADDLAMDFAAFDQLPLDEMDPLAAGPTPGEAEGSDDDVKSAIKEATI